MRTQNSLTFTLLALALLILVKVFVVDGIDQYTAKKAPVYNASIPYSETENVQQGEAVAIINKPEPVQKPTSYFARDMKQLSLNLPQPESIPNTEDIVSVSVPVVKKSAVIDSEPDPVVSKDPMPQHIRQNGKTAKVVIIIDDMGLARANTRAVMDLPAPLTLAFLPYAENLSEFTTPAKNKGHELIIHVPMEAMAGNNLGPAGLKNDMSEEELKSTLEKHVFPSFDGYVGINNHMGSKLTQNTKAMGWVMEELKGRGLYFVDSKTIGSSVAARMARDVGVPYAERDVFLDHYDTLNSVKKALEELERVAHRNGVAIAIGHPKSHTIEALRGWMPSMTERGLELVPASAVLHHPTRNAPISEIITAPEIKTLTVENSALREIYGPPALEIPKDYIVKEFKSISAAKIEAEQESLQKYGPENSDPVNSQERYQR